MNLSPLGLDFIKGYEQCRLTAYQDVAGIWTIGWGHTGPEVHEGLTWTQEQCDDQLVGDTQEAVDAVNVLVESPITQGQFDALVSFAFNVGIGSLRASSLLAMLNVGDYEGAANEFKKWNKSRVDGRLVPVAGLTKRRMAEADVFRGDVA